MSACIFMVRDIDKMTDEKLSELEQDCYRVLGRDYDKGNKFQCDQRGGMWHNLQAVLFERNRRSKKLIVESCSEHFNAINAYSSREGFDIEEIFLEYLRGKK